jgi:hypothetical protein
MQAAASNNAVSLAIIKTATYTANELQIHHDCAAVEQVDLALWGHHHSYQRTCHVANGKCTWPSSTVSETAGTGITATQRILRDALISSSATIGSRTATEYKGPVHAVVGMGG